MYEKLMVIKEIDRDRNLTKDDHLMVRDTENPLNSDINVIEAEVARDELTVIQWKERSSGFPQTILELVLNICINDLELGLESKFVADIKFLMESQCNYF